MPWMMTLARCQASTYSSKVRPSLTTTLKMNLNRYSPYRVGLYWSASATWATPIVSAPAKSAIVRDSFSTRW